MSDASRWQIPAEAPDWECTWASDEIFHLRYFRALPLPEKIRAVEQMEQLAVVLGKSQRTGKAAGRLQGRVRDRGGTPTR